MAWPRPPEPAPAAYTSSRSRHDTDDMPLTSDPWSAFHTRNPLTDLQKAIGKRLASGTIDVGYEGPGVELTSKQSLGPGTGRSQMTRTAEPLLGTMPYGPGHPATVSPATGLLDDEASVSVGRVGYSPSGGPSVGPTRLPASMAALARLVR